MKVSVCLLLHARNHVSESELRLLLLEQLPDHVHHARHHQITVPLPAEPTLNLGRGRVDPVLDLLPLLSLHRRAQVLDALLLLIDHVAEHQVPLETFHSTLVAHEGEHSAFVDCGEGVVLVHVDELLGEGGVSRLIQIVGRLGSVFMMSRFNLCLNRSRLFEACALNGRAFTWL